MSGAMPVVLPVAFEGAVVRARVHASVPEGKHSPAMYDISILFLFIVSKLPLYAIKSCI